MVPPTRKPVFQPHFATHPVISNHVKSTEDKRKNFFPLVLGVMKLLGLTTTTNQFQRIFFGAWKYLMLCDTMNFVMITTSPVLGGSEFHVKLETCSGMLAGFSMIYRHILFLLNWPSVLSLMRRIDTLMGELVSEYGPGKTIIPWRKMCSAVMYMSISVMFLLLVPAYSYSYYKYFTTGVVVAPYPVYIPFEMKDRIHAVVWYEAACFIAEPLSLVVSNTFIGTVVIAITGASRKIRQRFEALRPSSVALLKQTIAWHAEVIGILEDANALLGSVLMVDCLLSIAHISVSGYVLLKAGIEKGINLHKYIFLNMMCISIPSFFCICGHIIKLENEQLRRAIFQNQWHLLTPKERNNLILPAILAHKGLVLHYRRAINFDMGTYASIIRHSYSFLAILKLMDG